MRIFLATWFEEPAQATALTKVANKTRLISYWHTREKGRFLPRYVITGRMGKVKKGN